MNDVSYEIAIQKISNYTDKLSQTKRINPKSDDFTIVLPLKENQAVIADVSGQGEDRKVSYTVGNRVFVMKKLKNIGLNIFSED